MAVNGGIGGCELEDEIAPVCLSQLSFELHLIRAAHERVPTQRQASVGHGKNTRPTEGTVA